MSHHPRIVGAVLILCLVAGCAGTPLPTLEDAVADDPYRDTVPVDVEYVVDGDTVIVTFPDGDEATVRLIGIDAPESGDTTPTEYQGIPATSAGHHCLRSWASDARTALRTMLDAGDVTLAYDTRADRQGYYDRILAYLLVNETTVNEHLVQTGYARVYDTAFAQRATYNRLEAAAQTSDRGLWQCQQPRR